jgi:hypothetical protein
MTSTLASEPALGESWEAVRAQFALAPDGIHLGTAQFLSSHPRIVRDAIARHRRELDANPVACTEANEDPCMQRVREVRLYDGSAADADPDAMIARIVDAVTPRTRAVAVTWVHSDTGLKLPIAALARALRDACPDAARRPPCVDGTHGVGVETERVGDLGCDVLRDRRIVATVAPYPTAFLRFTPGLFDTPEEVDAGVTAIRDLATRDLASRDLASRDLASRTLHHGDPV